MKTQHTKANSFLVHSPVGQAESVWQLGWTVKSCAGSSVTLWFQMAEICLKIKLFWCVFGLFMTFFEYISACLYTTMNIQKWLLLNSLHCQECTCVSQDVKQINDLSITRALGCSLLCNVHEKVLDIYKVVDCTLGSPSCLTPRASLRSKQHKCSSFS